MPQPPPLQSRNWKDETAPSRTSTRSCRRVKAGADAALAARRRPRADARPRSLVARTGRAARGLAGRGGRGRIATRESRRAPFTGDVSAEMLAGAGATYVIVAIRSGARSTARATPTCAPSSRRPTAPGSRQWSASGGTRDERGAGRALEIVQRTARRASLNEGFTAQKHRLIAYLKPLWAIRPPGLVPSRTDVHTPRSYAAVARAAPGREVGRAPDDKARYAHPLSERLREGRATRGENSCVVA